MPMTVVVTTKVADRVRGFLASCMLEIAPGVYTAPRMNASVRERVWTVLSDWFRYGVDGAIVMTWPAGQQTGGQEVRSLGFPPVQLYDYDGIVLARRKLSSVTTE